MSFDGMLPIHVVVTRTILEDPRPTTYANKNPPPLFKAPKHSFASLVTGMGGIARENGGVGCFGTLVLLLF